MLQRRSRRLSSITVHPRSLMTTPIRTTGQLGPVLRSLRKARGWSQAELGRRVGLSQERISAIVNRP